MIMSDSRLRDDANIDGGFLVKFCLRHCRQIADYPICAQDYNDDIRQEQLREMQMMNSSGSSAGSSASSGTGGDAGDMQSGQQSASHLAAVRSVAGLPSPASSVMTLANPIHQQLSVRRRTRFDSPSARAIKVSRALVCKFTVNSVASCSRFTIDYITDNALKVNGKTA